MAQVSHSTSQDHIATAFHFFNVKRGPEGALDLVFLPFGPSGGSSNGCDMSAEDAISLSGDLKDNSIIDHAYNEPHPVTFKLGVAHCFLHAEKHN